MDGFKQKIYLVTGGAGFIGSNFIRHLFEHYGTDIFVINIDKLTYAGNLENLSGITNKFKGNYTFVKGDICDVSIVKNIFTDYSPDITINFAAESHVDRSINSPENFIKTNIYGTFNLLEQFKNHYYDGYNWLPKKLFIQISTDEVYGDAEYFKSFTESAVLNPSSPYAASKASADLLSLSYVKTYNAPIIITRSSNNFGPYQYPEKFIPLIINNCLSDKFIPIYGNGKNVRDWLFVKDNVQAIDIVSRKGKTGEIYNIGGDNEITNIDLAKQIINLVSQSVNENLRDPQIKFIRDRKGHDLRYSLDSNKIKRQLGWRPQSDFAESLKRTVNWYIKNTEWLKNIMGKDYISYYKTIYGDS